MVILPTDVEARDPSRRYMRADTRRAGPLTFFQRTLPPPPDQLRTTERKIDLLPTTRLVRRAIEYNCAGLVLGARRGWLVEEHDGFHGTVVGALRDDGFVETPRDQLRAGDVVTYGREREIEHIGVVTGFVHEVRGDIMVLSKFGVAGEYLHAIDEIPESDYGRPLGYWTQEFR